MRADEYRALLAELREATLEFDAAFDSCPPDLRDASPELRGALDRLREVTTRYEAERD